MIVKHPSERPETKPHRHDWINDATGQQDDPVFQFDIPQLPYYRDPSKRHSWTCRICQDTCFVDRRKGE